ncbi:uncharacterized protein V6R79_019541 [Siganus canaliculatus]
MRGRKPRNDNVAASSTEKILSCKKETTESKEMSNTRGRQFATAALFKEEETPVPVCHMTEAGVRERKSVFAFCSTAAHLCAEDNIHIVSMMAPPGGRLQNNS